LQLVLDPDYGSKDDAPSAQHAGCAGGEPAPLVLDPDYGSKDAALVLDPDYGSKERFAAALFN